MSQKPFGRARDATKALAAILKNPDDTKQVFLLLDALSKGTPGWFRASFAASRTGAQLLADRPSLLAALRDHAALERLPDGSLGRAYLDFLRRDGLTTDFLAEVSTVTNVGERPGDEDGNFIEKRMRDSHDLWHVVTGYRGDLLGEAALLTFSFAQTYSPGIGLLVGVSLLKADEPDARRLIVDAFARGIRAAWLPAVPWEAWLADDLQEVRARLRVGPPPVYEPFFARDLPPGGLFAKAA